MARATLTKKIRFEVFKRDSFTCQYCGQMAPDVILEVDHINPVVNGGDNKLINLVTSCFDCNRGKGKRALTDKEEIKKQQDQLKELNEKRKQLEMLLQWRDELSKFDDEKVSKIETKFKSMTDYYLNDKGRELAKKWIKEFGLIEILDCLEISVNQYFKGPESVDKAFNYIPRIASSRKKQKNNPMFGKHEYIRGILYNRNMLRDVDRVKEFLSKVCDDETEFEMIREVAVNCKSWTDFWNQVNQIYGGDY